MIEKIGIIGGGQLGRMLTEAAHPLGFQVTVLDPTENCPATMAGAKQYTAELQDEYALDAFTLANDVTTWEIEHINAAGLQISYFRGSNIQPSPHTLRDIQDKYVQKQMLKRHGLPVAPAVPLTPGELPNDKFNVLAKAVEELGPELMVKTRTGGFDGRGNLVFDLNSDNISERFGANWDNLYVEKLISFEKELSVIVARDMDGKIRTYPTFETSHEDSICNTVVYPASVAPELSAQAQEIAYETMAHLLGAGIFAIEMFATDKDVIINEIAPRVHNSGHLTIEASETSQFEQHIRAITGMPLGSTEMRSPAAVMINILGSREEPLSREGLEKVLKLEMTHPHFYGKSSRKARKIGHITVLGASVEEAYERATYARRELVI